MNKKQKFNIKDFLAIRPLSWSALSSFEFSEEQWYRRYILNEKQPENPAMVFGKVFANSIELGKPLAPVTIIHGPSVKKGENVEHQFKVNFNGIPLIGFADTFDHKTFRQLGEFKTSKTNTWDQNKVDNWGQLTMYVFMNFITNKVPPEEMNVFLECIQTEETGDFKIRFLEPIKVHHFDTKRTTVDILRFGDRINRTVDAMQKYVDMKLSTIAH